MNSRPAADRLISGAMHFDFANRTLQKLGGSGNASSLLFAKFSPDGRQVAYGRANNIYVEDLASRQVVALTTDGTGPARVEGDRPLHVLWSRPVLDGE